MTSLYRGPYELLHQLGEGGMGTVWLATHRHTRRHVAVKILMDRDARIKLRFRREIKILQQLQHPGIVPFIESGIEEDGELWYAMELLKGKPLSWHLKHLSARWPTPHDVGQMSTLDATSSHWTDRLDDVDALLSRTKSSSPQHSSPRDTPRLKRAHSIKELRAALATTQLHTSSTTGPALPEDDTAQAFLDDELVRPARPWPDAQISDMLAHLAQVCTTLAHVHGEGIVHCDIKPENIVITEQGDAIVVDFGIAERFGARVEHDVLEGAGIQAGTAFYISPEQIRGEPVDARTDLYAMGCILYEVLTGQPPFVHGTPMSVLLKHLSKRPDAIREHSPALPKELDDLCAMLLAKSPESRPGHALGVARSLTPHTSGLRPWTPTPPEPKSYLYRARLTGRDALIDALDGSLQASATGQTLGVTLGGESGVGKSSIAAEIIGRARNRDFVAMSARCEPTQNALDTELLAGPPLHAFEPILRQIVDTCTACDEETARRVLLPHAHHLRPYSLALQELTLTTPIPSRQATHQSPKRAQKLIFSSLYQLIASTIEQRPLLMLFDDLHGADELSLQAITWITQRAQRDQKRWLMLAFYASDEMPERLNELLSRGDWIHHRIERLDDDAITRLCAQMLGVPSPDGALIAHVHAQTQGNPFFVAEYLKLAMERGQVRMDELGRWHLDAQTPLEALATPSSVRHIVDSRLARLPLEARELCEVASVVGHTISVEALQALTDHTSHQLDMALAMLVQREILNDELTHTYQFVHDRLREGAYDGLEPARRAKLHRKAARWLRAQGAALASIATHYERGQRPARASKLYLSAARLAADQFAFGQSEELFERAFPLLDDPVQELEERMTLVQHVLLPTKQLDGAEAQLEIILKGARRHELATLRARALTLLARTCMQQGRLARAERLLDEAASRFDALASGQGIADTLYELAHLKLTSIELDEARRLADEARQTYLRVDDRMGQAHASLLLGEVCWRMGRLREAESTFEQALSLHQRLGLTSGEAEALTWLAQIYGDQKRVKHMTQHLEAAHALYKDMDDASGLAQVAILKARRALVREDESQAVAHLHEALTELERTHDPHHHVIALTELARIHMLQGDEVSSVECIERARQFDESPLTQSTLSELEISLAEQH